MGIPFFDEENYRNVGKNAMISILDIYEKNPYSRIPNSNLKNIQNIRKETAIQGWKKYYFSNNLYRSQKLIDSK